MSAPTGQIFVTERAVSRIVAEATRSVPGTTEVGHAFDRLAARSLPRYDVLVDPERRTVSIEAFIAVTWPAPVTRVAEEVRTTIIDWVRGMTGLRVTHCNIVVGAVVKGEQRVTKALIDAAPGLPELRPLRVKEHTALSPEVNPSGATQRPLRPITVTPWHPLSPANEDDSPADHARTSTKKGGTREGS